MADKRVLRDLKKAADDAKASPRERKALYEAALVESNARDIDYGDRDSVGVLQQRPSQGWKSANKGPYAQAREFLRRARQANKGGGTAGQLAQSVQRSAFPERYDQRGKDAKGLMGKSPGGGSRTKSPVTENNTGDKDALLKEYLARRGDPSALRNLAVGLKDSDTASAPRKSSKPSGGSGGGKNPWKAALAAGGSVSSGKRPGAITSSGNVSDHSESAPGQMARDFVGKDMNKIAHEIARALGIKDYKPGSIVNVKKGGKKYQLIYGTSDHKDHVHLGRKRA